MIMTETCVVCGAETWVCNNRQKQALVDVEITYWKICYRFKRRDHISHAEIRRHSRVERNNRQSLVAQKVVKKTHKGL